MKNVCQRRPPPPAAQFDKQQAGLAGLSFDEGRFGVFAYVTEGMDNVVPRLASGGGPVSVCWLRLSAEARCAATLLKQHCNLPPLCPIPHTLPR